MEQLDLFSQEIPEYTYRTASNGDFVVTAEVPGVGRITARDRFLWPAVSIMTARYHAALKAKPDAMF